MTVFPVSDEVIELASSPFGVAISTVAAFQAATAELVRREAPDLIFWTHDSDRATAALARGLDVAGLDLH